MEKINLHKNHRERMRERFRRNGLSSFEDHEVLEMLLFSAIPRRNTNDIAHALLDKFGNIASVLSADKKELCTIDGIGESAAEYLLFLGEMFLSVTSDMFEGVSLDSEDKAGMYASVIMETAPAESAVAVYLNKNGMRISEEWLYRGKIRMTDNLDSHIVDEAKRLGASSVILIHNHKHEPLKQSPDDVVITQKLRAGAKTAGIDKIWHVIVADNGYIHI